MKTSESPELLVGGQALIEGVMMRSPGAYGIAVRKPDGSLALKRGKVTALGRRYPVLKLPVLRGVAVLFQSLAIGIRALNFSAEQAVEAEKDSKDGKEPSREGGKPSGDISNLAIAGSMVMGLGLGIVIFLLLPLWFTQLSERYLFGELSSVGFNLLDGGLRAVLFLIYLWLISRMKDIHRVFMYHGAEHKVVFTWEDKAPLTVDAARVRSRFHPRCGTSFLLFVLLVSVVLFAFIPKTAPFLVKFGGRLVLMPLVAGLSYEVLRLSAKLRSTPVFAAVVAPGLALQKITTQEPTDDMLEVAIVALEEALREDGLLDEASSEASSEALAAEPAVSA
jgi:uncharacterized protein YqhQ